MLYIASFIPLVLSMQQAIASLAHLVVPEYVPAVQGTEF